MGKYLIRYKERSIKNLTPLPFYDSREVENFLDGMAEEIA
jgi:hypothetical protein